MRRAAGGESRNDGAAPFEMFPFGGLLESLMGTPARGRSDTTLRRASGWRCRTSPPTPELWTQRRAKAARPAPARRPPRRSRVQPRPASTLGPFGDLMGSLGGVGGSGQFEVEALTSSRHSRTSAGWRS